MSMTEEIYCTGITVEYRRDEEPYCSKMSKKNK